MAERTKQKERVREEDLESLKKRKVELVAEITALKAESAKIASQLARSGAKDWVSCW